MTRHGGDFDSSSPSVLSRSAACQSAGMRPTTGSSAAGSSVPRGGDLVRLDPRRAAHVQPPHRRAIRRRRSLTSLMQAKLVRINRVTDEVEPWLAESWTRSDDGLRYIVKLRPNVTFSDGHAVDGRRRRVFARGGVRRAGRRPTRCEIDGKKLRAEAVDPLTVGITLPGVFAPGLRMLDRLPVLPRHKLEAALKNGTIEKALGLSTPPSEIVGLGPFVLREYLPGQRLVFARNPHYWRQRRQRRAAAVSRSRRSSTSSPTRTRSCCGSTSGQSDMTASEVPAEAYATDQARRRREDAAAVRPRRRARRRTRSGSTSSPALRGGSARGLAAARRAAPRDLDGRRSPAVRGHGVPRRRPAGVRSASRRPTSGGIGPTRRRRRTIRRRRGRCSRRSASPIGTATACSKTRAGRPARFTLLTQKGRPSLERGVAVIRDELKKIGARRGRRAARWRRGHPADPVGEVRRRVLQPDRARDTDPASSPDFWLSSGSVHFWNIGQKTPATDWETRDRRADGPADALDRRSGAQAAVRRGAEDLRRAPAGDLLRRAPHLRGLVHARAQRDAGRASARSCSGRPTRWRSRR